VFAAYSEVQGTTAASIKAELVAGAGLVSRIEATFGLDKQVNAEQIAATRVI
jgi:hypothetical protein